MIKSSSKKIRNILISIFVVLWLLVYHYESTRHFFLNPLFNTTLPKLKFLFPPAGWIMFYNVDDRFGYIEVVGQKGNEMYFIDPHEIIETRTIGFDNIFRNILSQMGNKRSSQAFGRFLKRKFPEYDGFVVSYIYFPDLVHRPQYRERRLLYRI